jgi:hypothetical protein
MIRGLVALLLVGCVSEGSEHQLGIQVMTLTETGPQRGLPADADTLRVLVQQGARISESIHSVFGTRDLDGDGPDDRELAVSIPPDTPVSITIIASKALQMLATARVDGVVVPNGGRRFVNLTFTPIHAVGLMPYSLPSGRFGHAAERIPDDGRVLVTGGFTTSQAVVCPAALTDAVACFQLEATDEAYLVNPSDGMVVSTLSPMLRPRALHTATALGDGRILIAGGLSSAVLGLIRVEGTQGGFELQPRVVPADDGYQTHGRSFEIFDPDLLRELEDVGRDGDLQAGDFIGTPGEPSSPGNMNSPRFLHAAAVLPGSEDGVLLVGGQGSLESPTTGEVFLARRPGGTGFLYPPIRMSDPANERVWPAAVTAEGFIYVIGGAWPPTSARQLIDRWVPGTEAGSGSFQDLSTCPGWTPSSRPHNAFVGPGAALMGNATNRVLAVGWMGPLCLDPEADQEATVVDPEGTVACAARTHVERPFTVGIESCTFGRLQNPASAHFLGAVSPMPRGEAIIAGGFANGRLDVTNTVEVLTGEFSGDSNLAMRDSRVLELERGRAWHTATQLHGGRVILIGGMSFSFGAEDVPNGIDFSGAIEVYDPGWDPTEGSDSQ